MAWSAPSSVTTGDLITAATWNQDVVDNVQYLYDERVICLHAVYGWTSYNETTTSTSYVTSALRTEYMGSEIDETEVSLYAVYTGFTSAFGGTAFQELYTSGGTAMTSSEGTITQWGDPPEMIVSGDFSGDAGLLTGDGYYEVYHKSGNGAWTANTWEASILVVG